MLKIQSLVSGGTMRDDASGNRLMDYVIEREGQRVDISELQRMFGKGFPKNFAQHRLWKLGRLLGGQRKMKLSISGHLEYFPSRKDRKYVQFVVEKELSPAPSQQVSRTARPRKDLYLYGMYKPSDMATTAQIVVQANGNPVPYTEIENNISAGVRGRVQDFKQKPIWVKVERTNMTISARLHPAIEQMIRGRNTDILSKREVLETLGLKADDDPKKQNIFHILPNLTPEQMKNLALVEYPRALRIKINQRLQSLVPPKPGKVSASTVSAPQKAISPFQFKPGHKSKPAATTATIPGQQSNVNLRQNEIQEALYRHLVSQYGKGNVSTENPTITGEIDVVVRQGAKYWFYEIKTASSVRECIREALAQLLEYSFWPGAQEAERLIIVGEPSFDSESKEFLGRLKKRFALSIEYQQFDFGKGKVSRLTGMNRNEQTITRRAISSPWVRFQTVLGVP